MAEYRWIKSEGKCSAEELMEKVLQDIGRYEYAMLLSTDRFELVRADNVRDPDIAKLLEIRAFSESCEICARRGSVGEEFGWRVAAEDGLEEKKDYIIREHFLDINGEKSGGTCEENGNIGLITTVGGKYSLPISPEMKKVRIIEYITYSGTGMARIADARICGFV